MKKKPIDSRDEEFSKNSRDSVHAYDDAEDRDPWDEDSWDLNSEDFWDDDDDDEDDDDEDDDDWDGEPDETGLTDTDGLSETDGRKPRSFGAKKKSASGDKKKEKKRFRKWVKRHKAAAVVIAVLLVCLLTVAGVIGSIIWNLNHNSIGIVDPGDVDPKAEEVQIAREDPEDEDVINILLVGSDSRDPNAEMGRSDTMMVASFNKTQNKATVLSFLRDCLVEIDGYGQSKLGHTLSYGGVGLTINTINQQFGLDIQNYITINFDSLVGIIDQLGGIQVWLSAEEAEYYRATGMPDAQEGENTLTGSQALAHARNRSLDNDFGRTERQRDVLYGIYNKVMQNKDPAAVLSLINYCMSQVSTNMSVTELYDLAMDVLGSDHLLTQQAAVPEEGTYTFGEFEDMSVVELDLEANKEFIKNMLY